MIEELLAHYAEQPLDELRKAMGNHPVIWLIIRKQIQSDPCRDHRVIMRRYRVSRGFVYKVWHEQIFHACGMVRTDALGSGGRHP